MNNQTTIRQVVAWVAVAIARLNLLSADIDRYDGKIINAAVGANFAIIRHFGVGFAYNHFELDVGVKDDNWRGEVEQKINGPFVHLTASW